MLLAVSAGPIAVFPIGLAYKGYMEFFGAHTAPAAIQTIEVTELPGYLCRAYAGARDSLSKSYEAFVYEAPREGVAAMYPIFTLQAAAIGVALLVSVSSPLVEAVHRDPQHVLRAPLSPEPVRLHCRLYFGCAPVQKASAESTRD